MKRFTFRLESLLEIKRRNEEEVKRSLARKNGEILSSRQELNKLDKQLLELFMEEKKQRVDILDLAALRFSLSYRVQLQKDLALKRRQIQGLESDAEKLRNLLVKARKETRILELLKEKRLGQWKKEYRAEERAFVDDVSQKSHIRKKQGESHDREADTSSPAPRFSQAGA
jgi:flagellar FliJ protein